MKTVIGESPEHLTLQQREELQGKWIALELYTPQTLPLRQIRAVGGTAWECLESLREAKVILAFHVVGTGMEVFKTAHGSWLYPEASLLRIGGVPLFSGFMYAAVGSYIARVWRIFDFRFDHYPPRWATIALATAIYVNFFTHHWLPDIRLLLFAVTANLFWRTPVWFTSFRTPRAMPLLLGWFLVALFIWGAENIGTFSRAWLYPGQRGGWHLVSPEKLGAWYLLMIISFVLVSLVNRHERRFGAGSRSPISATTHWG